MNQDFEKINAMMGSFKNFGCSMEELKKSLEEISKQKEVSMIEPQKQYETMDGSEARVYATDGGGDTPIHGAVKTKGGWIASVWDKDGNNPTLSDYDLIEKWEPREGEYCWFGNSERPKEMTLAMFSNMDESGNFVSTGGVAWKYCYQYESDLPAPIASYISLTSHMEFNDLVNPMKAIPDHIKRRIEVASTSELNEHEEVIVTYLDQNREEHTKTIKIGEKIFIIDCQELEK